jgi:hypothetical protein
MARYYDDGVAPTATEDGLSARWGHLERVGADPEKRRHHYIPQMWLRRWAGPGGQVDCFDFESHRNYSSSPINLAVVKDLYRVGTDHAEGLDMGPEDALAEVEGAASAVLDKVQAGGALTEGDRLDLSLLVVLQLVRVPHVVADITGGGVSIDLRSIADFMLSNPNEPVPATWRKAITGDTLHDAARRLLEGADEYEKVERGFSYWNLLHHGRQIAARVARRQWTIVELGSAVALIGDNPVPVAPLGDTTFKADGITASWDTPVPIGPRHILAIGNRPEGSEALPQALWPDLVAVSNRIQFESAKRYLFSAPKLDGDILPMAGTTAESTKPRP